MSLDLGSLDDMDPKTRTAFQRAVRYINQLEGKIAALEAKTGAASALTPQQIAQVQKALSSTGSNPLNLSGLTGTPTVHP